MVARRGVRRSYKCFGEVAALRIAHRGPGLRAVAQLLLIFGKIPRLSSHEWSELPEGAKMRMCEMRAAAVKSWQRTDSTTSVLKPQPTKHG